MHIAGVENNPLSIISAVSTACYGKIEEAAEIRVGKSISVRNIEMVTASPEEIAAALRDTSFKKVLALAFVAEGAETTPQLLECLSVLAETHATFHFLQAPLSLLQTYRVSELPTTVLFAGTFEVGRFAGADTAALVDLATPLIEGFEKTLEDVRAKVTPTLQRIISSDHVVVFMKGSPEQPRCKFTRKLVGLLETAQVTYSHYDILQDDTTREWLKRHSNWPTFPQVYVSGQLVGGVDIVEALISQGEFAEVVNKDLQELVQSRPVMLFMKGTPTDPQCGFSERMVLLLQKYGVEFGSFNILSNQSVRERLKAYSHWPTYPQLYVKGELIGGIDIAEQMDRDGELEAALKVD